MKTKTIKTFPKQDCILKVVLGTFEEYLTVKYSCSQDQLKEKIDKDEEDKPEKCYGLTSHPVKGWEDPDKAGILIWLNIEKITRDNKDPEEILVHELIHVKQKIERKFFKHGDQWPVEYEAYWFADMFIQAKEILK